VAREQSADVGVHARDTIAQSNSSERARAVKHFDVVVDRLLERQWIRSLPTLDREPAGGTELLHEVWRLGVMIDLGVLTDDSLELKPIRAMDDLRIGHGHHRVWSKGVAKSGECHIEV
jgi:hypothetical protein